MKKIIFLLSLAIISSEAKMEIKDLIKNDGGSYKGETQNSYKDSTSTTKTVKPIVTEPIVTKPTEKNIKEKPIEIITMNKQVFKQKVIDKPAIIEEKKEKTKKIKKNKSYEVSDKIKPKRDIKSLLSLDQNDISINETTDVKTNKKIYLSDTYLESITSLTRNIWNESVFHNGEAKINLIMNTTKGKLEKIFVLNKKGNKDFKIDFKVFMKRISKQRFMKTKTISGLIEIKILLKKQIEDKMTFNKISILKNNKGNIYKEYMEYLVKSKGYSLSQIKKMLHSEKNTVTKNMLYAIYADYTKNNEKEAKQYYNIVINNKLDRFIKSTEGLYLADFALREGKDRLVLKILPRFSCQFMDEPEKNHCYYYRARALHHLGKEYEIPLNIVRYKLKEAKIFYQDISGVRGGKDDK